MSGVLFAALRDGIETMAVTALSLETLSALYVVALTVLDEFKQGDIVTVEDGRAKRILLLLILGSVSTFIFFSSLTVVLHWAGVGGRQIPQIEFETKIAFFTGGTVVLGTEYIKTAIDGRLDSTRPNSWAVEVGITLFSTVLLALAILFVVETFLSESLYQFLYTALTGARIDDIVPRASTESSFFVGVYVALLLEILPYVFHETVDNW
jgi:hypothetical protein